MKCLKILTLIFVTVTFSQIGRAQTVSTLVASFTGNDGLSVGSGGFIYVNDRGSWTGSTYNGTRVMRVDPTDGSYIVFARGLNSFPVGSVFDRENNLFVTGANSGTISRITPAGEDSLIASGMAGSGGLEFDSDGNFENPAFFQKTLTASFTKSQEIREIVQAICVALGLTYSKSGKHYEIKTQ